MSSTYTSSNSNNSGEFKNFHGLIGYVGALFVLICVLCVVLWNKTGVKHPDCETDYYNRTRWIYAKIVSIRYEYLYQSSIGFVGEILIFLTRLGSVVFLTIFALIHPSEREISYLFTFAGWANLLVCSYFALSSILSLMQIEHRIVSRCKGVVVDEAPTIHSISAQNFSLFMNILYQVAGSAAYLVTLIHYVYFNQDFDFVNTCIFLAPAAAIFIDMCLNMIPVYLCDYAYMATLGMAYFIFVWVSVKQGEIDWPYAFLYVSDTSCYAAYTGLIATSLVVFLFFYALHKLRDLACGVNDTTRLKTMNNVMTSPRINSNHSSAKHTRSGKNKTKEEDDELKNMEMGHYNKQYKDKGVVNFTSEEQVGSWKSI